MKITTLNERIAKAEETIAKKENTIVKKTAQIEKKKAQLSKLGYPEITMEKYREICDELDKTDRELSRSIYWTLCDIKSLESDIVRGGKEIEEKKLTLEKYRAQLAGEIERESLLLKEIPESLNKMRDELVETWDAWDRARRERLNEKYSELGYTEFMKKYNYADYQFRYVTDSQIHDSNVQDAKLLILNLYYRVKDITGEITSWDGIEATIGTWGGTVLNGYVEGKEGRARVESILAGGYNIQRLHVRVLVKEYA